VYRAISLWQTKDASKNLVKHFERQTSPFVPSPSPLLKLAPHLPKQLSTSRSYPSIFALTPSYFYESVE